MLFLESFPFTVEPYILISIHTLHSPTLGCRRICMWNTGSSFTLAPKQSCWKSKANFHFTARQLSDTEQMNAAANKSIKSYIKTTNAASPCDFREQRIGGGERRRGGRADNSCWFTKPRAKVRVLFSQGIFVLKWGHQNQGNSEIRTQKRTTAPFPVFCFCLFW